MVPIMLFFVVVANALKAAGITIAMNEINNCC
jgi:hypothetical protein